MELVRSIPKPADKKPEFDYLDHYLGGFIRNLQKFVDSENIDRDALKRAAFFGVKYVTFKQEPDDMDRMLQLTWGVRGVIAGLTPAELVTIFPVTKTFDGDRTESKDYFFTMEQLQAHGMDKPLGEAVHEMMWDYRNLSIEMFTLQSMTLIDKRRRMDGKPGMLEEVFGLKPKYLCKDERGKQYLFDPDTGRTVKVRAMRKLHAVTVKTGKKTTKP